MTESRTDYTVRRASKRPRFNVLNAVEERTLPPLVLRVLQAHIGRLNAITARSVATQLGMHGRYDDRKVRAAAALLRKDGKLVGATFSKPPGFYMIANEAEWRDCLDELRGHVIPIWQTYGDLAHSGERAYGVALDQMRLEL